MNNEIELDGLILKVINYQDKYLLMRVSDDKFHLFCLSDKEFYGQYWLYTQDAAIEFIESGSWIPICNFRSIVEEVFNEL